MASALVLFGGLGLVLETFLIAVCMIMLGERGAKACGFALVGGGFVAYGSLIGLLLYYASLGALQ